MNKADPHLGKPPSNGAPDPKGSPESPSFGSASPTESSGPGRSSIPRPFRRRPRARRSNGPTDGDAGPTIAEAAASGWRHALELGDYARDLIGVRADRAATDFRRKITRIGVIAIAGVGVGVVVISASLRFVAGVADGLAILFGGRGWLGDLAAGVVLLGGLAAGVALFLSARERKELEEHIEKYERHHREHRARHGHFVGDPSPEAQDPR